MSKSTKEKERLKSIKMYEQEGIPVPLELIKIKLMFKEPKRKDLKYWEMGLNLMTTS